ncbi:MAG: glycosyltransferase family 2 protein [Ruminococcaceae bacterium]|nr:glycosyltransferase family 2 protein [Oscillospiraceae bacterium]
MANKKPAGFPLVSVIVPVYGTEPYLNQCVQSIVSQTYPNLEIILVDDESPDSCPSMCDNWKTRDNRIEVIHKKNGGLSHVRKVGLERASGSYVMFVDSDDWIDHNTVECCVSVALNSNSDCVMFGYVREYGSSSMETHLFENSFSYDYDLSESRVHSRIVGLKENDLATPQFVDRLSSVCMKLYKTETARSGRIVSERVVGTSEDTIFNLYALDNCRISYIDYCFYHYRKTNDKSITQTYKSGLSDKWDVMYAYIAEYVEGSEKRDEYRQLFLNRVSCGMIGLGLNEVACPGSLRNTVKRIRSILEKPLYKKSFAQLDTSACGVKWKLFFFLCKHKMAFFLTVLLKIINLLRSRVSL